MIDNWSPGVAYPSMMPSTSTASRPLLVSTSNCSRSSMESISERLKDECAAAALTIRPSTFGETIGPPAEKLYAVEPVGVATITASAA